MGPLAGKRVTRENQKVQPKPLVTKPSRGSAADALCKSSSPHVQHNRCCLRIVAVRSYLCLTFLSIKLKFASSLNFSFLLGWEAHESSLQVPELKRKEKKEGGAV